jgi:hypothetical protein
MIKKIVGGILLAVCVMPLIAGAASTNATIRASFRSVATLETPRLVVTEVVEVAVPPTITKNTHVGVFDVTGDTFIPYQVFQRDMYEVPAFVEIDGYTSGSFSGDPSMLMDRNHDTTVDFLLPDSETAQGVVTLRYTFERPITSSQLQMSLDQYAVTPKNVSINAVVNGSLQRVVAVIVPKTNTISFPELTSDQWEVKLEYVQPLRFTELSFVNKNIVEETAQIRFLAQPDSVYQLYYEPEVIVPQYLGERPNLFGDKDIITGTLRDMRANPQYQPADQDEDGVIDQKDNCPGYANTDQADINANGRGDVCDDYDRDGVMNQMDNCVEAPNYDQTDIDRDGIGDACDTEESRVTEKYPAIVWVALGLAALIFVGLFFVALKHQEKPDTDSSASNTPPIVPPTV